MLLRSGNAGCWWAVLAGRLSAAWDCFMVTASPSAICPFGSLLSPKALVHASLLEGSWAQRESGVVGQGWCTEAEVLWASLLMPWRVVFFPRALWSRWTGCVDAALCVTPGHSTAFTLCLLWASVWSWASHLTPCAFILSSVIWAEHSSPPCREITVKKSLVMHAQPLDWSPVRDNAV